MRLAREQVGSSSSMGQWAAANCAALPTANAGQ